jgi:hypothetical protein
MFRSDHAGSTGCIEHQPHARVTCRGSEGGAAAGDDAGPADPGRTERNADGIYYTLVGAMRRFSMNTLVTVACGGMAA